MHVLKPNEFGLLRLNQTDPPENQPSGGVDAPGYCQSSPQGDKKCKIVLDQGSHRFKGSKALGSSNHLEGNVGNVSEGLPGHDFIDCESHDDALLISGSIDASIVTDILKTRFAMKKEREVDRNAAGNSKTMKSASIAPRTSVG